jgi:hypothetical protein
MWTPIRESSERFRGYVMIPAAMTLLRENRDPVMDRPTKTINQASTVSPAGFGQ